MSSQQHSGHPPRSWGVVVPAKPLRVAKSRLGPLGEEVREHLVTAFLHDTVSALLDCDAVRLVVVVTDDVRLADVAAGLGAWCIPDGHGSDLNASLTQGAADVERRAPGVGVLASVADLPCLRPDDVAAWLQAEPDVGSALVADTAGAGTTMLRAASARALAPRFGPNSRAAHAALEVQDLTAAATPGMRLDVDTPADLAAARLLGVGQRTRWALTLHDL